MLKILQDTFVFIGSYSIIKGIVNVYKLEIILGLFFIIIGILLSFIIRK